MNKTATADAALDFASEDMFASNTPVKKKPATMAAVEHDAIADDVTLQQCEENFQTMADMGASVLAESQGLVIASAESANMAVAKSGELKKVSTAIDEARKRMVKPFNDFVDQVNEAAKRRMLPFTTAAKILGDKVVQWNKAEKERIAAEKAKAQKEAEASLLAGAKPVVAAEPAVRASAAVKIPTRTTYTWELENFDLVPDEYKMVVINKEKLDKEVSSQQIKALAGIKIIKNETLINRR